MGSISWEPRRCHRCFYFVDLDFAAVVFLPEERVLNCIDSENLPEGCRAPLVQDFKVSFVNLIPGTTEYLTRYFE